MGDPCKARVSQPVIYKIGGEANEDIQGFRKKNGSSLDVAFSSTRDGYACMADDEEVTHLGERNMLR